MERHRTNRVQFGLSLSLFQRLPRFQSPPEVPSDRVLPKCHVFIPVKLIRKGDEKQTAVPGDGNDSGKVQFMITDASGIDLQQDLASKGIPMGQ